MTDLRARLMKSSSASAAGLLARVGQQLVMVPILLSSWSVQLYGEWLLLSVVQAFLAVSDLGFVTAGSNELARRASTGKEADIQSFYDRYSIYIQRWSLLIGLFLVLCAWLLPLHEMMGLQLMTPSEASGVFLLLSLSALVAQNSLSLCAGLRAKGRVHYSLWIRAASALLQMTTAYLLVCFFDVGPVVLAASVLLLSIGAYWVEWYVLRQLGLCQSTSPFRRLAAGAEPMLPYLLMGLEMMLMPLAQILLLQGSILVVGMLLNPVAAAAFATHRTLARLSASLLQLFSNPLMAEAGLLQRPEDKPMLARAVSVLSRATFWFSVLASAGLMLAGAWIFVTWTHGQVRFEPRLLAALLIGVVAESMWRILTAVRMGTNRHRPVVWGYLGCSVVGLLAAILLGGAYGTVGVAVGVSLADIGMAALAVWLLRGVLDMTVRDFMWGLVKPPIREMTSMVRQMLSRGGS